MNHPILGPLTPDPFGKLFSTSFQNFDAPTGIDGLCKITGDKLELLAVYSEHDGQGNFRRFIADCKTHFATICIWQVDSRILQACLPRYGFRTWSEKQQVSGEWQVLDGFRWDK